MFSVFGVDYREATSSAFILGTQTMEPTLPLGGELPVNVKQGEEEHPSDQVKNVRDPAVCNGAMQVALLILGEKVNPQEFHRRMQNRGKSTMTLRFLS